MLLKKIILFIIGELEKNKDKLQFGIDKGIGHLTLLYNRTNIDINLPKFITRNEYMNKIKNLKIPSIL